MKQMLEDYRTSHKAIKGRTTALRQLYTKAATQNDAALLQQRIQLLEDEERELRAIIRILEIYLGGEQD